MKIITVSREFGSGGRELGRRLAESLGFAYYDREIITEIAKRTSLDEKFVENNLEKGMQAYTMHFGMSFSLIPILNQSAIDCFVAQKDIITELAKKGDCVIVGRSADVILSEFNPFNLFIYADMDSKINRCKKRMKDGDGFTDKELAKKIKQIDKERGKSRQLFSDTKWGDRQNYHLLVNTSGKEIEKLIPAIKAFALEYFNN